MFDTLLVANRGEIACRVFRTARAMGLRTVAVYSEADAKAMHVEAADQAVCIGPPAAADSYLRIDRIIDAARATGAGAIHPGYGFLSENAAFAEACDAAGLIFVGPPAEAIRSMGSKVEAKRLMEAAGVPVLPGYHGDDQDPERLFAEAERVGYPLLIKASAGGGGKGMRLVVDAAEFQAQLQGAKRESTAAFGDDAMLLERYLTAPKHIEVQIMADGHGKVVHLFERDCSVQRRHQKVVEEAPAPTVDADMRARLGATAVMAARQVGYRSAGTVEFIAQGDDFYFMEMNTRLQVEHPVTELVTGLDLVALQLRIAAGEALPFSQDEVSLSGHAIEVRLYAENPRKRFLPSTGRLEHFAISPDIRCDSGVRSGDLVTPHYDPMLAKLISYGVDRPSAIRRLATALAESQVAGVEHNLNYLLGIVSHPLFAAGDYTTGLADEIHDEVTPAPAPAASALAASFVMRGAGGSDPWTADTGFRVNQPARRRLSLRHGKRTSVVDVGEILQVDDEKISDWDCAMNADGTYRARIGGRSYAGRVVQQGSTVYVMYNGDTQKFALATDDLSRFRGQALTRGGVVSPMPGQVIAVNVAVGDKVVRGQTLVVVEAMKMEHAVKAPRDSVVVELKCESGTRVEEGVELVLLKD